ncbi:guanosine-3',5'-bis(diphosphate) 3'-pyrophosphohydrolase MESH1 isoform X1 [Myotis daubentonii]|uniref:guanosine-3',5'-bis(diphosphate) 3'-pyrophosphohydrolase MESH1 isoform X1 n=1 Tax=Myotis daubentonii TaxID=98922 RepID=UPI002873B652|nr:guanosine-3',5'-bis(diphosphate) 3'-pyrophosphohydrolase MESH1 isoform X1 [Myotis daubentonii]
MGSEVAQLLEAADFAAHKHRRQRRLDPEGTPYINHPIGVARILTHEAGITDIAVLQAALLHDTVEDTDTTLDELELHFGAQVRRLVEEVTDDKTLPKLERKRLQVEHAPHSSPGAKLVKLADKLYNLRDLNRCTPEEIPELGQISRQILPPSFAASRLPFHGPCSVPSHAGWSEHRVQEYFEWAAQVVKGLQGTSRPLEEALQQLFKERGLAL